jgi:hypothetical protein
METVTLIAELLGYCEGVALTNYKCVKPIPQFIKPILYGFGVAGLLKSKNRVPVLDGAWRFLGRAHLQVGFVKKSYQAMFVVDA